MTLDDRIRAAFSPHVDLHAAKRILDHMRFRLGYTYAASAAKVAALAPGVDFEEICQDIDAMEADAGG